MLFNSFIFLTLFLPVSIAGYYLLGARSPRAASVWLCVASFLFYGWWNPSFVLLLTLSIAFNFAMSWLILSNPAGSRARRAWLAFAIVVDLAVLVRYKYLAALIGVVVNAADIMPAGWVAVAMEDVALPLGVSFFTFTQIGYLLDCNAGIVKERDPLGFIQFVTFFPHLIAGPILHHKEMMTQFARPETYRLRAENLSIGLTMFTCGLAKKLLLADTIAPYADHGFAAPHELQMLAAWGACLAYAMQLYFDFSGYSDMAMGLAKMFGVRFPLNFNSPFKAGSIIEFWQRWHMTLTRYLTSYLYYPLAMRINRARMVGGKSTGRLAQRSVGGFAATVAVPTFYTMGLAGVWHGAGLQYFIYGLLHAAFLSVNHGWRAWQAARAPAGAPAQTAAPTRLRHAANVLLTFFAALVAFIFFRAHGVHDALQMLGGMAGVRGIEPLGWPAWGEAGMSGLEWLRIVLGRSTLALQIVVMLAIVWCLPNVHQWMGRFSPALERPANAAAARFGWRPSLRWSVVIVALLLFCMAQLHGEVRFLYFQF
ncbi:MBOAT family protein [Ralstonia sp. ASV6]|uniref:MBOAT family O-acyltransferase n=1 Tax=Ralstonia sp. ASV6 TaxID=2795124 RepID=UPI0018EDB3A3|nr:MBOAT family protein [Ralstonia sp. ASV6]